MQDLQWELLVRGKRTGISQSFSVMYGVFERFLPITWLRTPRAARAWGSRAAWVQLLLGAWGCQGSQQRWVCSVPEVCRLAQRWLEMRLGVKAVGCAGDSSMAGLWCRVSQGILQPLSRVVTGLANKATAVR